MARHTPETYLTASLLMLQYFALTGVTDLCVFGAKQVRLVRPICGCIFGGLHDLAGWGALIGSRLLYPSSLRYAKSIALMLFSAAVGCVLEGLASPTVASAIGLSILATAGGGVYPAILALLTPDVAPGKQGHLQGALYAVATLGSVAALGIYLALFNTTETFLDGASIWLLSAAFFVFAAVFSYAAGERITVERARRSTPSFPESTTTTVHQERNITDVPSNRSELGGREKRHARRRAPQRSSVRTVIHTHRNWSRPPRWRKAARTRPPCRRTIPQPRWRPAPVVHTVSEPVAVGDDSDERAVPCRRRLQGPPARRRPAVRSRLRWHCK